MILDSSISAIVTGGASGLGEGTARALAALGVRVTIFDVDSARGAAVAGEIGGAFSRVDVTSQQDVEAGFAMARERFGQERILVNCAGIVRGVKTVTRNKVTGAVDAYPMEVFEQVVLTNLVGTFRCLSASAAGMAGLDRIDDERGVIINTASVAAVDGQLGQAAYSASKGGVLALTLPVARDLASEGIRVNVLLPGIMETPMMASLPDKVQSALAASIPFPRRMGRPAEFASLVLEMCRNGYLNGESVRIDGAIRLAPR